MRSAENVLLIILSLLRFCDDEEHTVDRMQSLFSIFFHKTQESCSISMAHGRLRFGWLHVTVLLRPKPCNSIKFFNLEKRNKRKMKQEPICSLSLVHSIEWFSAIDSVIVAFQFSITKSKNKSIPFMQMNDSYRQ